MSIIGSYVMHVACDHPACCAKNNLIAKGDRWVMSGEAHSKNYSQARMKLIREGWKIRKNKALCPACLSAGVRMRDLTPRRTKDAPKEDTAGTQGPGTTESTVGGAVSGNGDVDTTGVPG